MTFKDYFSKQSSDYLQYRPHYPHKLFAYIASQCAAHHVALDVATGSGQAAVALTEFFDHVIAIDGSQQQLSQAIAHPNVEYHQATAEATGVEDHSVDCVTVAQALHWFHFDAFFKEVKRVLLPDGILAVWCYPLTRCEDKAVNKVFAEFYGPIMQAFWPPERRYVEAGYQNIDVPFTEIGTPQFSDEKHWTLNDFAGYLGTWSSVQKYREQYHKDPVADFVEKQLLPVWNAPDKAKTFIIEFPMRVFRVYMQR